MNPKEFIKALKAFEDSKNISPEMVIDLLKSALISAYQKENGKEARVRVEIDDKKGKILMFNQKEVVEECVDDVLTISLHDAQEINKDYKLGDIFEIAVDTDQFDRMAALYVKQVLRQKIREAEKQYVYDAYINLKDDIITGIVERVENNYSLINIGKTNALMPASNSIPNERYYVGQHLKVYVVEVDKASQGAQVIVSRTEPNFLKRLFENEISEIYDGTVEIRSIARDPGERAKVAVSSRDKNVDPTGACIGVKGMRIQKITNQLSNEKIDVVEYHEIPELYIAESLKPANVYGIAIDKDTHSAIVVVPNEELSLAIGKKGQNARLAVKLTGWKIDIKTVDTALQDKVIFKTVNDIRNEYENIELENINKKIEEVVEPSISDVNVQPENLVIEQVKEKEIKKEVIKEKVEPVKEEVYVSTEKFDIPIMPRVSVVEETKPIEVTPKETTPKKDTISKKAIKKAEKEKEDKKSINYMPVYTDEELRELEESEKKAAEKNKYEDDIDYDEFDEYYDK
ncbi:MAG: transcription termination factor NusA [Bacilli bacterium]|nr:transcription termination factor NusA [Bacilli bacterium]